MTETTHLLQSTVSPAILVAFELGAQSWKLAVKVVGVPRERIRHKTVAAGDLAAVHAWLAGVRAKARLPLDVPVWSCYEAGRDGFWIHRALEAQGVRNLVVDAASIEVPRRKRRAKTDRLDAEALVTLLERYLRGEQRALHVVPVPSEEDEDARELHRELASVKRARGAVSNRIRGLLAKHGVRAGGVSRTLGATLESARRWDGTSLPPQVSERLQREWAEYQALTARLGLLEGTRREQLRTSETPAVMQVRQLMQLSGIGVNSAWLFVFEFFGWRKFQNRRQVGALAGLTPTPSQSGERCREQGISGAGNRRVRTMAVEIAWRWLDFQPESRLARWYQARYGHGTAKQRRIGIVALARKLLIALWRYSETGTVPEGAVVKA